MFLTGYDDIEYMDDDSEKGPYYRRDNVYILKDEYEKLQKELDAERQRADSLANDYNNQIHATIRAQNWRIATTIVAIILIIVAWVYVGKYDETQSDYNKLQSDYNTLYQEYDFYSTYAVMVSEHGSYYHKHGCEKFTADTFWIYNISAAEDMGYKRCKSCWYE